MKKVLDEKIKKLEKELSKAKLEKEEYEIMLVYPKRITKRNSKCWKKDSLGIIKPKHPTDFLNFAYEEDCQIYNTCMHYYGVLHKNYLKKKREFLKKK